MGTEDSTTMMLIFVSWLLSYSVNVHAHPALKPKVIYGLDHRHELFEEPDPAIRILATSTVALIETKDLYESEHAFHLSAKTFGEEFGLCPNERYAYQPAGAFCSGFLIAPDLVVTAGHCLPEKQDCANTAFVFGYSYKNQDSMPDLIAKHDVYTCRRLIVSKEKSSGIDFALVKLDREVVGRTPLAFRSHGQVRRGDPLLVIGHPGGIPAKIAGGGHVRDSREKHTFVANLDVVSGNSGSPVFNFLTHEVEGILVGGEEDFIKTREGCHVSLRCTNNDCVGEEVVRTTSVLPYLNL